MKMEGKLATLLIRMESIIYILEVHVNQGKWKKILHVVPHKALYGLLKSDLLLKDLLSNGFKLNMYDPCVVNNLIDGKQMTITWYMMTLRLPIMILRK